MCNPDGISKECGKGGKQLLGFPCFPYSVISMACLGNAFHQATLTAKASWGQGSLVWMDKSLLRSIWCTSAELSGSG